MNKEMNILIAGGFGLVLAAGIFTLSRWIRKKNSQECYYDDFFHQFKRPKKEVREEDHGIEYLYQI